MKKIINWKLFFILLATSTITSLMVLPYALTLSSSNITITPVLLAAQMIQSIVLYSIAIFLGLLLVKRTGFKMPILDGSLKGKEAKKYLKSILGISISLGILAGILIILFSLPFGSLSSSFLQAEVSVSTWKSLLASFYGGISEEILLRLCLMTFLVWITFKIKKTKDGLPTTVGIWAAIIISSIIFGLGHLPVTSAITAITPIVVIRAIALNGIGGIIFGWLYWKKGLESAMISHFSADIVLHVALPIIASLFI
ncbi:MAG: CPBP family glutamic-type intramembrane protease [Patescibacteria group bacterium]